MSNDIEFVLIKELNESHPLYLKIGELRNAIFGDLGLGWVPSINGLEYDQFDCRYAVHVIGIDNTKEEIVAYSRILLSKSFESNGNGMMLESDVFRYLVPTGYVFPRNSAEVTRWWVRPFGNRRSLEKELFRQIFDVLKRHQISAIYAIADRRQKDFLQKYFPFEVIQSFSFGLSEVHSLALDIANAEEAIVKL